MTTTKGAINNNSCRSTWQLLCSVGATVGWWMLYIGWSLFWKAIPLSTVRYDNDWWRQMLFFLLYLYCSLWCVVFCVAIEFFDRRENKASSSFWFVACQMMGVTSAKRNGGLLDIHSFCSPKHHEWCLGVAIQSHIGHPKSVICGKIDILSSHNNTSTQDASTP
jgi:hypothetical protein